jgi:transcriptional regulator with XRE-family HTH domain
MLSENQRKRTVFGRTLMALRKGHHLTQEEVARILKIKRSTYAYYESETTPTPEVIKQLATLFNVSVHFLLFGEDENNFEPITLCAPEPEEVKDKIKQRDLKPDERILIAHYRLLSSQNKAKIQKETEDLFENQYK